ncbi:hypothetical protein EGR_02080 [Echinococcus granulosus]|uniref:Uncharacterized protein n=1 Tax=Echinococcus granulosus TaxID=6210 RepID=W6UQI1_ECHGR|nr:hypothetical protein EGR_02080 [Echinococcus granulosus]EUB62986.1 hypothetical protein EGR_02080 [Echinococcus granulosus]
MRLDTNRQQKCGWSSQCYESLYSSRVNFLFPFTTTTTIIIIIIIIIMTGRHCELASYLRLCLLTVEFGRHNFAACRRASLGCPLLHFQSNKRTADYSTSDSFYKDRKMCCKEVDEKTQSSDGSSCRTISPLWRYVLITGGITLIVIVLGTSLAFDFGMQGPLLLKVRSSSLFIKWENYCYRPLQSLLLRALQ